MELKRRIDILILGGGILFAVLLIVRNSKPFLTASQQEQDTPPEE